MSSLNHIFARQWFNSSQNCDAINTANLFEKLVISKRYAEAESILNTTLCPASLRDRLYKRLIWLKSRPRSSKFVVIKFIGFWKSFDIVNNPLSSLLIKCSQELGIDIRFLANANREVQEDIAICSCYGESIENISCTALRIAYLPEPVYPDFEFFDYSISQYQGNCLGKNIYLPLYLFELNCQFVEKYYPDRNEQPCQPKYLYTSHQQKINYPDVNFCIVSGNATSLRNEIIDYLENIGFNIDKYGSTYSNNIRTKYDLKNLYKFHICPENSLVPGYISEKIIHARACNAVPIYCCPDFHSDVINTKSIINIDPCKIESSLSIFKEFSPELLYTEKINEPLLLKAFNYNELYTNIKMLFSYFD